MMGTNSDEAPKHKVTFDKGVSSGQFCLPTEAQWEFRAGILVQVFTGLFVVVTGGVIKGAVVQPFGARNFQTAVNTAWGCVFLSVSHHRC